MDVRRVLDPVALAAPLVALSLGGLARTSAGGWPIAAGCGLFLLLFGGTVALRLRLHPRVVPLVRRAAPPLRSSVGLFGCLDSGSWG